MYSPGDFGGLKNDGSFMRGKLGAFFHLAELTVVSREEGGISAVGVC